MVIISRTSLDPGITDVGIMCITFFRINNSAHKAPYRLILIANRDEDYHRKSKAADYWKDHPDILGGLDLACEPYGTWLAASRRGRIGVLLNIHEGLESSKEVHSRGLLITNFLKQDSGAEEYLRNVLKDTKVYNGHHLLLFTLTAEVVKLGVLTSLKYGEQTEIHEFSDGIYGMSNSPISAPYQKVLLGKQKFEEIVNKYDTPDQKETLVAELKSLLLSQTRHYPDEVLYESKKGLMPPSVIEKLGSIFVNIPEIDYGTRTHTIILVDWNNKMDFWEYTMTEAVDGGTALWNYKKFEVELNVDARS